MVEIVYPLDDRDIGGIPPIEFTFFEHVWYSLVWPILASPRAMVSHLGLLWVLQRLVRCILPILVMLGLVSRQYHMANASDQPTGMPHFVMVLCSLI